MFDGLRIFGGVARSLLIYYGDRKHGPAMDAMYRNFVKPGDLVFEVGAHVGDRIASFLRLGARVVAAEPQPALIRTLRFLYGRRSDVILEAAAVGGHAGMTQFHVNLSNPTVSTASSAFIEAAGNAEGWLEQSWTRTIDVPVVTLDEWIARHGTPTFIKIDVEGYEAEVLQGLNQAVPALSFEFTTIQRAVAQACISRCAALGYRTFNAALGESHRFEHVSWCEADAISRWVAALPDSANSGDIYARMD
jgi:FkbM family methyltransferase